MDTGILKVKIREAGKSNLTPARVSLQDASGKFYYPSGSIPYERDNHFTVNGEFEVSLPAGEAKILIEKGKEYKAITSEVIIQGGKEHVVDCELQRWVNMADLGWYSGDTHIHRPLDDMAHLILADDLNVAPDITAWNQRNEWADKEIPKDKIIEVDKTHFYGILSHEDERGGGAVLMLNIDAPIDLGVASRCHPTNFAYCRVAHERGFIVEQEKPFWWEAPINVALGGVDTIGIINNHMQRETIMDNEAWGKPRDKGRYPGYPGFVANVLDLYYGYLNLGLKLPIAAGSASGVLRNPVGYNRLYVHLGDNFSYGDWFAGMKAGKTFATNGPMLFFSINGCELGATLKVPSGQKFQGEASLSVLSQTVIARAEVLYNGEIIHEFSSGGSSELKHEFDVSIDQSGWIAARAFERNEKTVRFAHTNPIYIEIGSPMKPNRQSAQYYSAWCNELLSASIADKERYATNKQREEVESLYRGAIAFYEKLAAN